MVGLVGRQYMNDEAGHHQIFCWIDNNIVKMVSNIHNGTSSDANVLRNRKKAQINEFNRKHVGCIWSDQHRKELMIIPQAVINDYNH